MPLTPIQVRHVAKLARLKLSDSEVDLFTEQLSGVLEYMTVLNEVDTSAVLPTSQVTGLKNVTRPDEVSHDLSAGEELLKCTNLSLQDGQIRVPKVF